MRLGTNELSRELDRRGYKISPAGISRAKSAGRATPDAEGKWDADEFVREMDLNTDAVKSKSARAQQGKPSHSIDEKDGVRKKSQESFSDAQTRKEIALADLRQLESQEKMGELVRAEETVRVWERHIDAVKNRLLLIEAKVPPECQSVVSREIRSALHELSEYDAA